MPINNTSTKQPTSKLIISKFTPWLSCRKPRKSSLTATYRMVGSGNPTESQILPRASGNIRCQTKIEQSLRAREIVLH